MNESDRSTFGTSLNAAMAVSAGGKPVGPDAFDLWFGLLDDYDLPTVTSALTKHIKTTRFPPTPHHIIEIIGDGFGYPSPEEAWNRLPKGESDGGYVNQQMMDGMGACSDSLERGDMISARMAFLESYKKSVETAKLEGKQAEYFYTAPTGLGLEERLGKKHQDTLTAINLGWLDKNTDSVKQMLAITSEGSPIALEDLSRKSDSKAKLKALSSIRERLNME